MPLQLYHLVPPGGPECGMAACEENVHERFVVGDNYTGNSHIFNLRHLLTTLTPTKSLLLCEQNVILQRNSISNES